MNIYLKLFLVILVIIFLLILAFFRAGKNDREVNEQGEIYYRSKDKVKMKELTNEDLDILSRIIHNLSGREFEEFCAEIFKLLGYRVVLTQATNDGGKDIILSKNGEKIFVECKHHRNRNSVGRPDAQKLCGAMVASGISKGIITSLYGVNTNCIQYCNKVSGKSVDNISIEAITINDLIDKCGNIDAIEIFNLLGIDNNDMQNRHENRIQEKY